MILNLIVIMGLHWIGDFVLQTDNMANNKSHSNKWLAIHVGVYTLVLSLTMSLQLPIWYCLVNGVAHFCTDYVTSRVTTMLYHKKEFRNFFTVIGFDQYLHFVVLALSLWYYTIVT